MSNYDADTIVIGSGSGGLNTALALARAGSKVMVLEQHYAPGGWCHNFTMEGLTFCPGVHYVGRLGPDGETRQIYEGLGVANDLTFFEQNSDAYEHCDIAGTKFDYPRALPDLDRRLQDRFPSERKGIADYMGILQLMVDQLPLVADVNGFVEMITVPYRTRYIGKYGLFSLKRILEARISDPHVRAILSIQCGDQGLPPGKTPMVLHAALARHYAQGGYYPKGGGGAIARAYVKAIKLANGKVKVGARVEKILIEGHGSKRQAIGVRLTNGRELRCRNVVSNADPSHTFMQLVGREHLSKRLINRLSKTRYSISSLHLFLGISKNPRELGLDSGNIWFSTTADFDKLFERFHDPKLYEAAEFEGLFVSAPTQKDPSSYTGKAHTLEVVTFVGFEAFRKFEHGTTDQRSEEYIRLKEKITAMFLKTLERVLPTISQYIVFCELGTPLTNMHYVSTTNGSIYGTEKTLRQLGPFSFRPRTEIPGLTLTGASTISHGVSGAAVSGLHAAASILKCRWQSLLNNDGQHLRVLSAEDPAHWKI